MVSAPPPSPRVMQQWLPVDVSATLMGAKSKSPVEDAVISVEQADADDDKFVLRVNSTVPSARHTFALSKGNVSMLFTNPHDRNVTVSIKRPATMLMARFKNDLDRESFHRSMQQFKQGTYLPTKPLAKSSAATPAAAATSAELHALASEPFDVAPPPSRRLLGPSTIQYRPIERKRMPLSLSVDSNLVDSRKRLHPSPPGLRFPSSPTAHDDSPFKKLKSDTSYNPLPAFTRSGSPFAAPLPPRPRRAAFSDPIELDDADDQDNSPHSSPTRSSRIGKLSGSLKQKGFQNLGNTCYLNAVLQALINLPTFVKTLRPTANSATTLPGLIHSIIDERKVNANTAIGPNAIVRYMANNTKKFNIGIQEDAHEFLLELLELLHEEQQSADSSDIQRTFGTTLGKSVACSQCGQVSTSSEHLRVLSVDLPRRRPLLDTLPQATTVDQLIQTYLAPEPVEYRCSRCEHDRATVRHSITAAPRVLVVHLKRFDFQVNAATDTVALTKRSDHVRLDQHLRVPCAGSHFAPYRLQAVVHHIGASMQHGHYVCDVFTESTQSWRRYDDSLVSEVELGESSADRYTPGTRTGYLLFYVLE
ncbi:Ubiquitin carboxyl-terminal hydrolase 37 [Sorochytrium milnesiophthora]